MTCQTETAAPHPGEPAGSGPPAFSWKLWLYTNYDCNLACAYCLAKSTPTAPRRALGLANVCRLVDEATSLGFEHIFFTGGEPFILDDIYDMLAYSSARLKTTVLTNAMLLRRKRLEKLSAIANENLTVQVSLDGGRPEHHDAYRGQGTWAKTVEGIHLLQERGFRVRLSTTETPANSAHLDQVHAYRRSLGIPAEDHFVRPLARRGFARQGVEVDRNSLMPEVTVTIDGVFWHPLAAPGDEDMWVSRAIFPLAAAVNYIRERLDGLDAARPFT